MLDIPGHVVGTTKEPHRMGDKNVTRYRGRCSCGHTSYMHYSTPDAARTAVERTHLVSLTLNEGSNA